MFAAYTIWIITTAVFRSFRSLCDFSSLDKSRNVESHRLSPVRDFEDPTQALMHCPYFKQGGCFECWCGNHVCYPPYVTPSEAKASASSHPVSAVPNTLCSGWGEGWNPSLFHPSLACFDAPFSTCNPPPPEKKPAISSVAFHAVYSKSLRGFRWTVLTLFVSLNNLP